MKRKYSRLLVAAILVALLIIGLVSFAGAKYATVITMQGKITFSARLADLVKLEEHKAEQLSDGSYTLGTETVTANSYDLIPGLDIPKDPYITITGKTPIEAFLFVEVVNTPGEKIISYKMDAKWKAVTDVTAKHGGTVYLYTRDGTETAILTDALTKDKENKTVTIPILADNTVKVSQHLPDALAQNQDTLTFYVYLIEKTGNVTYKQAYSGYPKNQ